MVFQEGGIDDNPPLFAVGCRVVDPDGVDFEFVCIFDGGMAEVGFVAVVVTAEFEVHATCSLQ